MAPRRPEPKLYKPIEKFGELGRQLSVERLEDVDTILNAVGTPDQLADWYKRHDLAVWIETALRSIVASIKDPDDRRIAQAVLATEPEFFGLVEKRKQYLREHDGISDDRYKKRRPLVIARVAAKLEETLATGVLPELPSEPAPAVNGCDLPTTSSEGGTAHPVRTQTATIEREALQSGSRKRSGRRGRVISLVVAAALVLEGVSGVVVLTHHNAAEPPHATAPEPTWNGMTAAEMERRYDGKLPNGQEGADSRCSDLDHPSLLISRATRPPVMGPERSDVAVLQLRQSQICPTVVWARVVWYGDEQRTYTIPPGWTLHVVVHRRDPRARFDETEPQMGSTIHFAYSRMLTSASECVFAEAYFTKDGVPPTESIASSCEQV